jgi:hypothetical protein
MKKWALKVMLVGLFELSWRAPHHDWLVEFLNTYQIKGKTIYERLNEKIIAINKHSMWSKSPIKLGKNKSKQASKL